MIVGSFKWHRENPWLWLVAQNKIELTKKYNLFAKLKISFLIPSKTSILALKDE
jgi:hypothetical protein